MSISKKGHICHDVSDPIVTLHHGSSVACTNKAIDPKMSDGL